MSINILIVSVIQINIWRYVCIRESLFISYFWLNTTVMLCVIRFQVLQIWKWLFHIACGCGMLCHLDFCNCIVCLPNKKLHRDTFLQMLSLSLWYCIFIWQYKYISNEYKREGRILKGSAIFKLLVLAWLFFCFGIWLQGA